jgi:hypothetical protein
MLAIIMALSLASASPVFTSLTTNTNSVQHIAQDNDPDETGGEGGHIPPIRP